MTLGSLGFTLRRERHSYSPRDKLYEVCSPSIPSEVFDFCVGVGGEGGEEEDEEGRVDGGEQTGLTFHVRPTRW